MNKKLLVIVLSFLITVKIDAKKVDGVIIYNNDSVVHVTFNIPVSLFNEVNMPSVQQGVEYYNASGEKIKLKPDSAKEIRFKYGYDDFRMLSCDNSLGISKSFFSVSKKVFLELEIDGKLRLFKYYVVRSTGPTYSGGGGMMAGSSHTVESFLLQKKNGELYEPRWLRFKKDMKAYLSDCPKVVARFDEGRYTKELIHMIVRDYNACR